MIYRIILKQFDQNDGYPGYVAEYIYVQEMHPRLMCGVKHHSKLGRERQREIKGERESRMDREGERERERGENK